MSNIKQALESAIAFVDWYAPEQELLFELKAALAEVEASSTNKNSNVLLDKCEQVGFIVSGKFKEMCIFKSTETKKGDMVYTSPPQQQWVGLSDKDIDEGSKNSWVDKQAFESVAWWAEAKLKELNT